MRTATLHRWPGSALGVPEITCHRTEREAQLVPFETTILDVQALRVARGAVDELMARFPHLLLDPGHNGEKDARSSAIGNGLMC